MTLVSFVASARDVVKWAGVPRKAEAGPTGTRTGFQRALDDQRAAEIGDFFGDHHNLSPTSLVVAFRPGLGRLEELTAEQESAFDDVGHTAGELRWLVISDQRDDKSTRDLVNDFLEDCKSRLASSSGDEDIEDSPTNDEAGFEVHDSHLQRFVSFLEDALVALDAERALPGGVAESELRVAIESLTAPAMLVDGQHRVFGALREAEHTPFSICGLLDASWEEQVFQFVVINQTSEGIPTPFLNAIVSSSLTQAEVERLESRLRMAGVRMEVAQAMDKAQHDPDSPFAGMIKFGTLGESGWLPHQGMARIIMGWYSMSEPTFTTLTQNVTSGSTKAARKESWQEGAWWNYFVAFWAEMRASLSQPSDEDEVDEDLWTSEDSQLMRVATMQTLQQLFLEWMIYSRRQLPPDIDEFRSLVHDWMEPIPREFFMEPWQGIKLPKDRDILEDVLDNVLKNPRYKWRNSRVFQSRN